MIDTLKSLDISARDCVVIAEFGSAEFADIGDRCADYRRRA